MKKFTVFFLFSMLLFSISGQHANFNSQRNNSLNKKEIQIGFGATQFNGDLGGADGIGTDYSLKDIDWPSTGVGFLLGYRQRFHPYFATTSSFCVFNLKGDDAYSGDLSRFNRNLHFKSFAIELQQRLEVIFASNEKFSATNNLPGSYSKKNRSQQYYLFGGVGLCYFNPRAQDAQGNWVSLRNLKTEGQDEAYSPLTLTIPMGIGFRVGISKMWRVGIELSYVKTFTDYMDDVSTVYADPASLSPQAVEFANMADPSDMGYSPGEKRGDPNQKDAYYHMNIVFTRNLTFKDYGPKPKKVNSKSTGKFKV